MTEREKIYQRKYYNKTRGRQVQRARNKKLRAKAVLEKYKLNKEERAALDKRLLKSKLLRPIDKKFIKEYTRNGGVGTHAVKKIAPDVKAPGAMAHNIMKRPAVQSALIAAQQAAGISENFLTKKLKEGLDAKETKFFAHEGVVQDQRDVIDFNTRHRYLETAHKLRGDLAEKAGADSGAIIINITEIAGRVPADVVEEVKSN
jgi:hypothetical protein